MRTPLHRHKLPHDKDLQVIYLNLLLNLGQVLGKERGEGMVGGTVIPSRGEWGRWSQILLNLSMTFPIVGLVDNKS